MLKKIIAYDLGTGGVKASLYDERLNTIDKSFIEYATYYPHDGYHEQAPSEWWRGVVESTRKMMAKTRTDPREVVCLALSGQSLVTVPINEKGEELADRVPIWSDTRATAEAIQFFERFDERKWYMMTGNGFPSACYSIFKLMWLKNHNPELYNTIYKVLGSKDYINYKLTGKMAIDYSYASGTGAYDLMKKEMSQSILEASGIQREIFPEIKASDSIVGHVTEAAAREMGLSTETLVACGGVDNACMALGSVSDVVGRVYTSLGSSSWIAVNSEKPVLDAVKKPFVFTHINDNMFTSAFSIFAGGSSLRWIRDTLCRDLILSDKCDAYDLMTEEAKSIPPGSNGVIFNPSLAGGTSQDKSVNIRGAFLGISLGTKRAELIHSAMEGIAMNLSMSMDSLIEKTSELREIRFCGGGAKNQYWMQMFADIFDMDILKTNIDQDAASIGAAAIAAKASGIIDNYKTIEQLHKTEFRCVPDNAMVKQYRVIKPVFEHCCDVLADLGDYFKRCL